MHTELVVFDLAGTTVYDGDAVHRSIMAALGFRAFLRPEVRSPIIATFRNPSCPAFNFERFYARVGDRGYTIYAGKLSKVQAFRIGTIGRLDHHDVAGLLEAIAVTLAEMGVEGLYAG
jgi:2-aminoethylphosphonate-pyruvate transaminase